MTAIALAWIVLSLVLGLAWIATEMRIEPRAGLLVDFAVAAFAWPIVLGFAVVLMLATESKPHDAQSDARDRSSASREGGGGSAFTQERPVAES